MKILPGICGLVVGLGIGGLATESHAGESAVRVEVTILRGNSTAAPDVMNVGETTGLIGVFTPEQRAEMLKDLKRDGVIVENTFGTLVRSGEGATVGAFREFPRPTKWSDVGWKSEQLTPLLFDQQDVGLTFEVAPRVNADDLELKLGITETRLIGFPVTGGIWQPAFSRSNLETSVTMYGGQSVLLRLGSEDDAGSPVTTFAMVSAEVLKAQGGAVDQVTDQVEIEAKFVETSDGTSEDFEAVRVAANRVLKAEDFEALVRALNQRKGVDLLSTPKVTTKVGQRAMINVVREFRYPTAFDPGEGETPPTPTQFETEDTGVILEVEPRVGEGGMIDLRLDARVVDFEGFIDFGTEAPTTWSADGTVKMDKKSGAGTAAVINQPVFQVRRADSRVSVPSGDTVALGSPVRRDEQTVASGPPESRTEEVVEITKSLFVFVTARFVDAAAKVVSDRAAEVLADDVEMREPQAKDGMTYGTPVQGKPGFVTSPHAPDAGYVDLRGFPPDTEVKCPYTGKIFLTP